MSANLHAHRLHVQHRPAELHRSLYPADRLCGLDRRPHAYLPFQQHEPARRGARRRAGPPRPAPGPESDSGSLSVWHGFDRIGAVFFNDPNFPERTGAGVQTIEMVDSGRRFASRDELLAAQQQDPGRWFYGTFSTLKPTSDTGTCWTYRCCSQAAPSPRMQCRGPSRTGRPTIRTYGHCPPQLRPIRAHRAPSPGSFAGGRASDKRSA